MLKEPLRMVKAAIATRDFVPALRHFAFREGRVYATDGRLCLCAPIDFGFSGTVPADIMWNAISVLDEIEDQPRFTVKGDTLRLRCGSFHVDMPTGSLDSFPFPALPPATLHKPCGKITPLIKALQPFIGEDASRPWSAGVHFGTTFAHATNNVIIARARLPKDHVHSGDFVLPVQSVDALLALAENNLPETFAVEPSAVTFFLAGNVWVRCARLEDVWPDVTALFGAAFGDAKLTKHPCDKWATAVRHVRPFCADPKMPIIVFDEGSIETLLGVTSARVTGWKFSGRYAFHATPLGLVLGAATHLDLQKFPRVPWKGGQEATELEGILLGIHL